MRRLDPWLPLDADLTEPRSLWVESRLRRAVQHRVPDVPPGVRRWSEHAGQACSGPSRQGRLQGIAVFVRPFGIPVPRR